MTKSSNTLQLLGRFKNLRIAAWVLTVIATLLWPLVGLGLAPTDAQSETIRALIDTLEERHYASKRYDDALSAQHLAAYIDGLDPQRMFFTSHDVASFSHWEEELDDLSRKGDLAPAFTIFSRYQESLRSRLANVVATLPQQLASFDYTLSEYIPVDGSDRPWAESNEELNDRWRKQLKNQALSLRLAEQSDEEIAETLGRRYQTRLSRLDQYNEQDVFAVYANALTELYDPHTSYFSPRRAENFDINMSLSFDGIGAVLQPDDEYTKVLRLVPAGPAQKQGDLQPSDLIIGVGQGDDGPMENVIGWRLDEVVDLIRGPRETTVRLEVIPGKNKMDERRVVAIQRNQVKLEEQSAKSEIIEIQDADGQPRKVGVIDIPAFYIDFAALRRGDPDYKSTTRDVAKLIEDLQQNGAEGLVIDLRNNGGGSLQEANDLTGLFIEYGPTVQIRSAERRVWRDGKRRRSAYYEGPVAVLINRLSASASEIFAGAMQDYGRGIVVGDRSFGKGTVQSLLDLPEGQLKVTESKFYRISGDSTQHRGVVPDILFPSLFDHEEIGESALDNALDWDQISPVRHRDYNQFGTIIPALEGLHSKRAANDPDFVFLSDQVVMAGETRGMDTLPLAEVERKALRTRQENRALELENKRRVAKGLEPLASLANETAIDAIGSSGDAEAETLGDDISTGAQSEDAEALTDDEPDVMLLETSRILADVMALSGQRKPLESTQTALR